MIQPLHSLAFSYHCQKHSQSSRELVSSLYLALTLSLHILSILLLLSGFISALSSVTCNSFTTSSLRSSCLLCFYQSCFSKTWVSVCYYLFDNFNDSSVSIKEITKSANQHVTIGGNTAGDSGPRFNPISPGGPTVMT